MTPREYADIIMPDVIHKQGRAVEEIERVIKRAILDEREACAIVCDKYRHWAASECAAAIRARTT